MDYHVLLKKELNILSVANYPTLEEAESHVEGLDELVRPKTRIKQIPTIRSGLRLFKEGKYYNTITHEKEYLWYLNNTENLNPYDDMVNKPKLLQWFIEGKLDCDIEEYDENYIGYDFEGIHVDDSIDKEMFKNDLENN